MSNTNKSTGTLTVGTTLINNGVAIVAGVSITAAAADVTVTLYDALTATSTVVFKHILDITIDGLSTYIQLPDIRCTTGLTAVVAGTGAEVQVHYR
ncbi:MAG: hypothetical protein JKY96_04460 [Phycisphaerales bacterium]|nr:hypothetical protein [Phycisphaerales bacterium]